MGRRAAITAEDVVEVSLHDDLRIHREVVNNDECTFSSSTGLSQTFTMGSLEVG